MVGTTCRQNLPRRVALLATHLLYRALCTACSRTCVPLHDTAALVPQRVTLFLLIHPMKKISLQLDFDPSKLSESSDNAHWL